MVATIGYEKASLDDFIATLKISKIDILVDIRDRAQSRRAGFSKTALGNALKDEGIQYLHVRELGDPKEGRDAARRGDYKQFRRIFAEVMRTDDAKLAISSIEELAISNQICLMCYERDQNTCHRKIVADHLQTSLGAKTKHLGVKNGIGKKPAIRRMHDIDQGATASV